MRKNKMLATLFLAILFLFSGCANHTPSSPIKNDNSSTGGDIMTENSAPSNIVAVSSEYEMIFSNNLVIYQLSRDNFNLFLENPSYSFLKNSCDFSALYPESGDYYVTYCTRRFPIQNNLIDFVGNLTEIKSYLSQNNVSDCVKSMAIVDAPNIPLTLWIKTTTNNVFITINEDPDDELYAYQFYTQQDFQEKYMCKNGKLIIRGKEVFCKITPKLYYNYADLPFTDVMLALGAEITEQSKDEMTIRFNGDTYDLDIAKTTLYKSKNKTLNLFYQMDGGCTFIYAVDTELMVDSLTLSCVLSTMGENIIVEFDTYK